MSDVIYCSQGCCPGCQDCYGMSIGCHQSPCRCDLPCSCRFMDEDEDPKWRDGCERHDDTEDGRRGADAEPDEDDLPPPALFDEPCRVCGSLEACATDEAGRPLIHHGGAS